MKINNYNIELTELELRHHINVFHAYLSNSNCLLSYKDLETYLTIEKENLTLLKEYCILIGLQDIYNNLMVQVTQYYNK